MYTQANMSLIHAVLITLPFVTVYGNYHSSIKIYCGIYMSSSALQGLDLENESAVMSFF